MDFGESFTMMKVTVGQVAEGDTFYVERKGCLLPRMVLIQTPTMAHCMLYHNNERINLGVHLPVYVLSDSLTAKVILAQGEAGNDG